MAIFQAAIYHKIYGHEFVLLSIRKLSFTYDIKYNIQYKENFYDNYTVLQIVVLQLNRSHVYNSTGVYICAINPVNQEYIYKGIIQKITTLVNSEKLACSR